MEKIEFLFNSSIYFHFQSLVNQFFYIFRFFYLTIFNSHSFILFQSFYKIFLFVHLSGFLLKNKKWKISC